jgi:hypothetical protein
MKKLVIFSFFIMLSLLALSQKIKFAPFIEGGYSNLSVKEINLSLNKTEMFFIWGNKVRWVIIHREIILDRKAIVQDYFGIDPRKGIIQKKAIAGWQLEYKPPLEPVPFLIFKVVVNQ